MLQFIYNAGGIVVQIAPLCIPSGFMGLHPHLITSGNVVVECCTWYTHSLILIPMFFMLLLARKRIFVFPFNGINANNMQEHVL